MPNDRRFDPHTPRPDYRPGARYQTGSNRDRYRTGGERRYQSDRGYREETGYRDFDNPEWRNDDAGEQYFGTGSHYGGGFGTAPGSRASGAGSPGATGYAREGAWSDESDWNPEQESPQRASFRGRGPKGYTRSDERLRETICERLTDDPRIDASEIEVDVEQQKVTLRGSVSDRYTKYAVEELVENTGAREIENELRVRRQTP
jgi:osmotically-inducible protein OsmY